VLGELRLARADGVRCHQKASIQTERRRSLVPKTRRIIGAGGRRAECGSLLLICRGCAAELAKPGLNNVKAQHICYSLI
jgi:hypothetical protein